ncbi:MAG: hypothetical protein EBZ60_06805 [Betaproteobacteria bacterium]|nr:hypothetical protein [Betaproteobacteria bacterium]
MSLVKNAIYLAWSDTKARYKTSVIGPFWPTLSNVLGVLCLGLVWGHLLKQDMNTFIPQLTAGLIVWQLIAGVLTDGPSTFTRHGSMIRNVAMPSWFFAVRALSKHLINLLHNAVIIVGVMWYYQVPLTVNSWLLVPGLLVIYRADSLPAALNVVWLNPFSYMIEAIRTPLLGGAPPVLTWTVLVGMLLVGSSLTWLYQRKQGKNLAFWV